MLVDCTSLAFALARAPFTVTGLATVKADDWASPSFASKGRSERCKMQRRALTDAYRRRFGEPSWQEIQALRRQRGDVLLPVDRTNLALAHAQARVPPPVPTDRDPDEILAKGRRLLRGDPEDQAAI